MTDIQGKEVNIGDKVVFADRTGTNVMLTIGTVIKTTPCTCQVRTQEEIDEDYCLKGHKTLEVYKI